MAQANSQNTTTQTRRGILRALASAPVVALVPGIPALASVRYGSDAFATLGAQLQQRWAAYASNRPLYEETHDKANELFYEALTQGPHELDINDDTEESEYWAASRRAETQAGFDKASEIDDRTFADVGATTEAIKKQRPVTIADLAVLANVCATTNPDLWEGPAEDLDWDVQHFRILVDEVLRLAGTKLILEGLPLPQTLNGDAHQRAGEFWDRKLGRPTDHRKTEIFKAFLESVDEIGSPEGVAPEVFRERALKAISERLACTDKELAFVLDEVEPIMKRVFAATAGGVS